MQWDSKHELGNERIDSGHRIFLGLLVDCHEASEQNGSGEKLVHQIAQRKIS